MSNPSINRDYCTQRSSSCYYLITVARSELYARCWTAATARRCIHTHAHLQYECNINIICNTAFFFHCISSDETVLPAWLIMSHLQAHYWLGFCSCAAPPHPPTPPVLRFLLILQEPAQAWFATFGTGLNRLIWSLYATDKWDPPPGLRYDRANGSC